jgi:hypothetical protein
MAYTPFSVVFAEQPSADKWNTLGTNDASFNDGTGIASGAITTAKIADANITPEKLIAGTGATWTPATWTPTLSGRMNDAKWDKYGSYIQIGKTVFADLLLVANTTTPMDGGTAEAIISLPVTSINYTQYVSTLGTGHVVDGGVNFTADIVWNTTGTLVVRGVLASGTYAQPQTMSSTAPFTWTTTDQIYVSIRYTAA